ncbi:MAG: DUF721 domain-containing protein [Kiritimatiellia bacterium]
MSTDSCQQDNRRGPELEKNRNGQRTNAPGKDFTSIAAVIPRLLARIGLEGDSCLLRLAEEWPALVGTVIAAHTRPGRVMGQTLVVFVDSSVWLSELKRFGQAQMLAKLQERFGAEKIRSLRFQPDPDRRE